MLTHWLRNSFRYSRAHALVVTLGAAFALASAHAHAGGAPKGPTTSPANPRAELLQRAWTEVAAGLTEASESLIPPPTPPQPVTVRWQARRISSVDLGAPLLALESVDLDSDGRAEIIALTTRELIIVERVSRRKLAVRSRAPLPAVQPAIKPRAPVGTMVVTDTDGDGLLEVFARASSSATGAVYRYRDGALASAELFAGFPLCAQTFAELEPGRNYFVSATRAPVQTTQAAPALPPATDVPRVPPSAPVSAVDRAFTSELPTPFFNARCSRDLVDPTGRALSAIAVLDTGGALHLWAERACAADDNACQQNPLSTRRLKNHGTAFALADIDRDGHPEVVVTAPSAPGDSDRVTVLSWRGARVQRLYQRSFSGGIVGLTAGDIDGDNAVELLAAVRLWGSQRVDIWVLNR